MTPSSQAAAVLRAILHIDGLHPLREPQRVRGLLTDQAAQQPAREREVLLRALQSPIFERAWQARASGTSGSLMGLAQWLAQEHGYAPELCHWGVETWALALDLQPASVPTGTQPPSVAPGLAPPISQGENGSRPTPPPIPRPTPEWGVRPAPLPLNVVLEWKSPIGPDERGDYGGHFIGPRKVSWTVTGNGTATCAEADLMWIQAPWGMQWNGCEFLGSPTLYSWVEAKQQFGCGVRVGLTESGTIGLSAEQIRSTGINFGYTRGTRHVVFAGYDDWRLPTLAEWYTLLGLRDSSLEKRTTVLQLSFDQYYWTATERHEPLLHTWWFQALGPRHNCAWAANADRWIWDTEVKTRLPIMLVRTV